MSTARALAKLFRDRFNMHLAWVPLSTSFRLGDYGVWRGGLFAPIGNIEEFGIRLQAEAGREISLDFVSTATSSTNTLLGARVPALPGVDVDAETRLRFAAADSFIVKVARLRSTRVSNIAEVARKLADARRWRLTYKVVGELFNGDDVLIAATSAKNTEVSLRGKASALRALQAGSGSAGVAVSADRALGLNIAGAGGPLGLGLFRVRLSGAPALNFSAGEDPESTSQLVDRSGRLLEIDDESASGELPEDDPEDDGQSR